MQTLSVLTTFSTNDIDARFLWQIAAICGMLLVWGSGTNGVAQTPSTTIENGNGDLRFQLNYDGGLYVPGIFDPPSPADSIPATGAGTRMMWYPAKAAFRAGRVTSPADEKWDPDSVGVHSAAFGVDPVASGSASMAIGLGTRATNTGALAGGASGAKASGYSSVALGRLAVASGNHAIAMGRDVTAASPRSLTIGECNNSNRTKDNSLLVAGNGNITGCDLGLDPGSDALVLDKDGNLSISGVFEGNPTGNTYAGHFRGNKDQTDADGPDSHVALVENTNTGFSASGLAIQTGGADPVGGNNFLTFYDGNGDPVGHVDGNGTGGVNFESGGADYAEELPVAEGVPTPEPTELVGVRAGTIRRATDDADQVLIASRAPAVTGNATPSNPADDAERVAVAFMGQVPVKVRGTTQIGDLIVASGQNDGTARAVAPSQYRHAEHGPITGQAWSAKDTEEVSPVTAAVGLGSAGRAAAKRLDTQQEQIDTLRKRVQKMEALEARLAEVEAKGSGGGIVAGLSGSSLLAVVLLMLGTGFGIGLRWRTRR